MVDKQAHVLYLLQINKETRVPHISDTRNCQDSLLMSTPSLRV